jgi:circadian clock protein KaiC
MTIGPGGIAVFPRYTVDGGVADPIPPIETGRRLPSGVAGLDELMGGGLLAHSVTLVSGSAGIGKSTFGLQFIAEGARRQEPGLYVSLEEGPAQLMKVADVLELPLLTAVDTGVAEMMYLSRDHVRASQFLAILVDKVREKNIKRLVLDGVSNIAVDGEIPEELRQLLFALMTRLKALGVTTLLTLESKSMHSTDVITDHGFSAIADNVIMLRYVEALGESRSSLSVIKTRGSAHDWSSYYYTITKGGIRIGDRVGGHAKSSAGKKKTTTKKS